MGFIRYQEAMGMETHGESEVGRKVFFLEKTFLLKPFVAPALQHFCR